MKRLTLLLVIHCCILNCSFSQDSLNRYAPYFGDYKTPQGNTFTVGRDDDDLFLMDYSRSICSYFEGSNSSTFRLQKTQDSISFAKDGTLEYFHEGTKESAKRNSKPLTEDFIIRHEDIQLGGTLWKPEGKKSFPLIILVHGSGVEKRYQMRFLPYYFTSLGYGVITYDKRGCGVSTGRYEPWFSGTKVLAGDLVAMYEYAEKRKDVQKGKIGTLGISNGAWVITKAATMKTPHFIIPVVGGFMSFYEQEIYRMTCAAQKGGMSPADITDMQSVIRKLFNDSLYNIKEDTAVKVMQELLAYAESRPWYQFTILPLLKPLPAQEVYNMSKAFWQREVSYDALEDAESLTCAIHGILGGADQSVPSKTIEEIIRKNRSKFKSRTLEVVSIPGAQHGMRLENTKQIAPAYLELLKKILLSEM